MDRGAWWVTVHRVTKSRIQLNNFHFFLCQEALWRLTAQNWNCLFYVSDSSVRLTTGAQ